MLKEVFLNNIIVQIESPQFVKTNLNKFIQLFYIFFTFGDISLAKHTSYRILAPDSLKFK